MRRQLRNSPTNQGPGVACLNWGHSSEQLDPERILALHLLPAQVPTLQVPQLPTLACCKASSTASSVIGSENLARSLVSSPHSFARSIISESSLVSVSRLPMEDVIDWWNAVSSNFSLLISASNSLKRQRK